MQLIRTLLKLKGEVLILVFVTVSFFSMAQVGYKTVDSTTFSLYQTKQWKELVSYGKQNELDYYYFNARMGEAYFHLKQYLSAEKYFTKALHNNETEGIKTFLFWTYLYMGERNLAEQIFYKLDDETKTKIGYSIQTFEQVYFEGGIKSSSVDTIGTMYYATVFLKHKIGKNVKMNYSYTPFILKSDIFEATNNQFNLFGSYYLGEKSIISLGGMFSRMDFKEGYENLDVPTDQSFFIVDEITNGTRKYSTNSYYLNYYYRLNRWRFNANLNLATQSIESNYINTKQTRFRSTDFPLQDEVLVSDTNTTQNTFIPSIGIKYAPSILKYRVFLGMVFYGLSSKEDEEIEFVFKPSISIAINSKIWVNASYFQVSERLFSDYTTSIFYNTNQPTKRFEATFSYMISPKYILKGTYIFEEVENLEYGFEYNLNSGFLGLQINL